MKFSMFLPVVVCEVDQSTGISCHTGVLPHTVVMTRPPICTPSLLMVTALHMETCFVSLPLKHSWKCFLSSETSSLLHLSLLLLIFSFFQHCKLSPIQRVNLELTWEKCSKTWNGVTESFRGPCAHHIIMPYLQLTSDLLGYAHNSVVLTAVKTNTPHCGMWILLNYWVSDHRVWIVYVCFLYFLRGDIISMFIVSLQNKSIYTTAKLPLLWGALWL